MQAVLGINLPGHEDRILVFPNQLKVGHEYLHLFIGGLRQRENLAARQMVHTIHEQQLERVTILNITDMEFDGTTIKLVHFTPVDREWTSVAFYRHNNLNKYTQRDNDIFFRLDPMNRRVALLGAYEEARASGGRRRLNRKSGKYRFSISRTRRYRK